MPKKYCNTSTKILLCHAYVGIDLCEHKDKCCMSIYTQSTFAWFTNNNFCMSLHIQTDEVTIYPHAQANETIEILLNLSIVYRKKNQKKKNI